MAIITLFLGTGIRISECVGLDIEDIDFANKSFKVTRKGGNRVILYFSDEVDAALRSYLEERTANRNVPDSERAFFVSSHNRRISVRAVENIVKKYALIATPLKKISPHKLRSTYGTNLYRATGDIYMVADVLGHRDVNTTKKHYAAITEDRRKNAAKAVVLRNNEQD
jgi:site-specific recombinase XerD